MDLDSEKAEVIRKLARKNNWGEKYDRLEHFKRFPNLKKVVKDLEREGWLIVRKKHNFTGISLDPHYKKEIVEFVEKVRPDLKGFIE